MSRPIDVEALNDRLATEHSIDDYYARSPLPSRLIERRRLAIIRDMIGDAERFLAPCFRVTSRKAAPHDTMPVRACFRCVLPQ